MKNHPEVDEDGLGWRRWHTNYHSFNSNSIIWVNSDVPNILWHILQSNEILRHFTVKWSRVRGGVSHDGFDIM